MVRKRRASVHVSCFSTPCEEQLQTCLGSTVRNTDTTSPMHDSDRRREPQLSNDVGRSIWDIRQGLAVNFRVMTRIGESFSRDNLSSRFPFFYVYPALAAPNRLTYMYR